MSFAAKQVRGLLGVASVAALGWCSTVQAQPAAETAPVTKTQPAPKTQTAPKAQPAPQAKPAPKTEATPSATPTKAAPAAANPSKDAPNTSGAAATDQKTESKPGEGDAADRSTKRDGESWVPGSASPSTTGSGGPETADPASPWPDTAQSPATNAAGNAPVYYVDRPPADRAPGAAAPSGQVAEASQGVDSSMRFPIEEPPVPPPQRHAAPRSALWLGARVGYFIPFGDLWGRCADGYGACSSVEGSSFGDVAASGPMFELDVGARLGRNYVVYIGWERAQLGSADGPSPDASIAVNQLRSESDFLALGFRLSSDPDDVGLLLDLAIGARRFRAYYEDSTELQLTQAPLESRLGIGVDIRTNRKFSLSPMLTLGIGSFGKADWVNDTQIQNAIPTDSDRLTHGWVTLQLGGHFDLLGAD